MAVGGKWKEQWKWTAEMGVERIRVPQDSPAAELDTWCHETVVWVGTLKVMLAVLYSEFRGSVQGGCIGSELTEWFGVCGLLLLLLVLFWCC